MQRNKGFGGQKRKKPSMIVKMENKSMEVLSLEEKSTSSSASHHSWKDNLKKSNMDTSNSPQIRSPPKLGAKFVKLEKTYGSPKLKGGS